jgi:thymidine kinase
MMPATVIDNAVHIYLHLKPETRIVGIDEGQFFDEELVDVCNDLAGRGLRVIVAGLDLNWKGTPFRPMPDLMAIAESVNKLHAVCVVCGGPASRTQRLSDSRAEIVVGDHKTYEPRCRSCFDISLALRAAAVSIAEEDLIYLQLNDTAHLRSSFSMSGVSQSGVPSDLSPE